MVFELLTIKNIFSILPYRLVLYPDAFTTNLYIIKLKWQLGELHTKLEILIWVKEECCMPEQEHKCLSWKNFSVWKYLNIAYLQLGKLVSNCCQGGVFKKRYMGKNS